MSKSESHPRRAASVLKNPPRFVLSVLLLVRGRFLRVKCGFPSGKSEPAEGFYVGRVGFEAGPRVGRRVEAALETQAKEKEGSTAWHRGASLKNHRERKGGSVAERKGVKPGGGRGDAPRCCRLGGRAGTDAAAPGSRCLCQETQPLPFSAYFPPASLDRLQSNQRRRAPPGFGYERTASRGRNVFNFKSDNDASPCFIPCFL